MMKWRDYKKHIRELDKKYLWNKPYLTRRLSLVLLYLDKYSVKNKILGDDYVVKYRQGKSNPDEVRKKSNKLDAWIIAIALVFWPILVLIPKGLFTSYFDLLMWVPSLYRLADIFVQRFRSIFVDPYFFLHKKNSNHLVDVFRSFVLAVINYIEIVFIFAFLYKTLSCGTFNINLADFDLIYFSFITITTVGFGDIYPKAGATLARGLTCFEVAFGLAFIIVVLGALVSLLSRTYGGIYGETTRRPLKRWPRYKSRRSGRDKPRR